MQVLAPPYLPAATQGSAAGPFDMSGTATADPAYREWRDRKLATRARDAGALLVEVRDPRALSHAERGALRRRIADCSMALYQCSRSDDDPALPRAIGVQLGLTRLDANWLADEDGLSRIEVGQPDPGRPRTDFIPYTDRAIGWHTDGYYQPARRRIRGMILHCVRPARQGGDTALLDHELAYIAVRDASPGMVRALMRPDALTIPPRLDADGVARAALVGPVFSVDEDGALHMRYTARTRSIEWLDDATTRAAAAALTRILAADGAGVIRTRLEPGMGVVGHNVLHARTAFQDDPASPRLLYRARYLDRVAVAD